MARKYTKMEILADEVFRRKEAGETNRQIAGKRHPFTTLSPHTSYDKITPTIP